MIAYIFYHYIIDIILHQNKIIKDLNDTLT